MSRTSLSRRTFVATAGAAGLVGASGLALPYYSRANGRPAFTHGVQSGDVDTESGMIWARADRPARVMFEVSTTESFANATKLPPLAALPESDFTVKRLLTDLAVRPGHLLPHDAGRPQRRQRRVGADRRPLPHRARLQAQRPLHLVRRHRGPGLGHRRHRHAHLCDDGQAHARLLPAFGRHHLCRRRHEGRGRTAQWRRQVGQQGADRQQAQGRRDARRIPRPVEIQPHGRALPRAQRSLPDLLPVGRPRGHEQLVVFARTCRRTTATPRSR